MTGPQEGTAALRLLVLITRAEDERRLDALLDEVQMPLLCQCRGKGTAPSEMLDIFGLGGTTRLLTMGLLPREQVEAVFEKAGQHLSVHQRGRGIAVTIPVTALQSPVLQLLLEQTGGAQSDKSEHTEGEVASMQEKAKYALIWTAVTSGFSDDVVDAARAAGAKGGTVLKGRRRSSAHAEQHLGLPVQEGQEFVMIVVPREKKAAVMSAISSACGLRTEARGVVVALPVEDVMGLEG